MNEVNDLILKRYQEYLENLAKKCSNEIFSNAGKNHASILMAIMFENTKKEARIFCEGFKADLIHTEPYFSALENYLKDEKNELSVLVESDNYIHEEPICLLKSYREKGASIELKKIRETDKEKIFKELNTQHCNFAVFDNDKFRLEYEPEEYKAMGSFNQPEKCKTLIDLFNNAFSKADPILLD